MYVVHEALLSNHRGRPNDSLTEMRNNMLEKRTKTPEVERDRHLTDVTIDDEHFFTTTTV